MHRREDCMGKGFIGILMVRLKRVSLKMAASEKEQQKNLACGIN